MTKPFAVLVFVGVVAVALWTLPIQAEMVSVGDSDLAAISGKSNSSQLLGDSTLTIGADSSNGNVQVGYYQWDDIHSNDGSDHKGGNDQSGSASAVQQSVGAAMNALTWGANAQVTTINDGTAVTGNIDSETWATLYVGGF